MNELLSLSILTEEIELVLESTAQRSDPGLWEKCKKDAIAKLGGKFSARAMQQAVKLYKERGGTYKGKKSKSNSLVKWGREKWRTSDGSKSEGKKRYLPAKAWDKLSAKEKAATNRAKSEGSGQFVKQPKKIAKKVKQFRESMDPITESIAKLKRSVKIPANPLFHVTGNAVINILRGSGLEAQGSGEGRGGGTQYDISMTRNLDWAIRDKEGMGRTILVFDRNEIKSRYKMESRNFQGYKQEGSSEFEERILTKKIPKRMIKGIIMNDQSDWMEKEWAGWPKHFDLKMFMVHYTGGKYKVLAD